MTNRPAWTASSISVAMALFASIAASNAAPATKPLVRKPAPTAKSLVVPSGGGNNAALTAGFNAYLNAMRVKLDKNWYVPDGKCHVTLTADLANDGSVTNLVLASVPPDTKAEQSASDAFNASQPLNQLPGGVVSCKLILDFTSTADPHGDSTRNIASKVDKIVMPGAKPAETTPVTPTDTPPTTNETPPNNTAQ